MVSTSRSRARRSVPPTPTIKMHGNRPNSITAASTASPAWKAAARRPGIRHPHGEAERQSSGSFPRHAARPFRSSSTVSRARMRRCVFVDPTASATGRPSRRDQHDVIAGSGQSEHRILMTSSPAQVSATQPLFAKNPDRHRPVDLRLVRIEYRRAELLTKIARRSAPSRSTRCSSTRRRNVLALQARVSIARPSDADLDQHDLQVALRQYRRRLESPRRERAAARRHAQSVLPPALHRFANPSTRRATRSRHLPRAARVQAGSPQGARTGCAGSACTGHPATASTSQHHQQESGSTTMPSRRCNPWLAEGMARASRAPSRRPADRRPNTFVPTSALRRRQSGPQRRLRSAQLRPGNYTLVWGNGQTGVSIASR